MRNFNKLFGIIALVAIIGFSMIACDDDSGGGGGALGDTLKLSGQVYTEKETETSFSYDKYEGNITTVYISGITETGSVVSGVLDYTIETTPTALIDVSSYLEYALSDYKDVKSSSDSVKGFIISDLSSASGDLYREKYTVSGNETNGSYSYDGVIYVYVGEDLTISGKGDSDTDTYSYGGYTINETYTAKDINLALKAGWNAVRTQVSGSAKLSGSTYTETYTVSVTLGNPSLNWVLFGGYGSSSNVISPSVNTIEPSLSETFQGVSENSRARQHRLINRFLNK